MKWMKLLGVVGAMAVLSWTTAGANEEIASTWYGDQPDVYGLKSRDTAGNNSYAYTPSPEQWRDKNIYQLFTDRFATDGVDRLAGYKPSWTCDGKPYPYNRNYHHGGNWKGLRGQLDYLAGMGVTAVWISGVQQNDQGKDPNYTPYHQYHVENFFKCDPAMGTFQDLKDLIDDCHARGMYVILDVAPNHMCDKNGINTGNENDDKQYWPNGHGSFGWWNESNKHALPFNNLNYFHPNGTINCWDCFPEQINGQFKGTDDLNTEHPDVQSILAKAFKNLIDATDCDGFRVDAIKHVPYNWCRTWAQNIRDHAAWRGKNNFLMFGELFSYDNGALASWCADGYGFNSALHFPLMQAMKNVFGYGAGGDQLGWEMGAINQYGQGKENVIAFLDNHDVDRFACTFGGGDAATAKKIMEPAMTFLYMAPPVPLVYYGTEHMFNQGGHPNGSNRTWDNPDDGDWQRECMFDKGFQPGNASGDMFSQWAKDRGLYGHISWLNGLRNKSRALRRGGFEQRRTSGGQGIYAFTKWYGDEVALVIVNTADGERDLGDINAGKGNAEFKENGVGPTSFTSAGNGNIAFGSTKIPGKGSKIFIANFVDNSNDVFGGGGGTPVGLWARNTYGYPTETATTADTIYINTEAGPASVTNKKVYLIYGFNNPSGNWPKVEMELNEEWDSNGGNWFHYDLGNLTTGRLDYVIAVETVEDGVTNTFWDNNGGGNYTMQIYPAPEPVNFSFNSVAANPVNPEPEGSVTVTVILRTAPATDISALAARIGYDIYNPTGSPAPVWPTHAMTRGSTITNDSTNVLSTFTYTVTNGLQAGYVMKYYIAASNGASILYANNGGQDYSVVIKDWPAVPADIEISTSNHTTQASSATVAGTAGANIADGLYWTNSLTGDAAQFELTGHWSAAIPLKVGTNVITVYGYEAGATTTNAADKASNYGGVWTNGANLGTGFKAWQFNHTQDGSTYWAGCFAGNPTNSGITGLGTNAFGFYANPKESAANAEVTREFASAMTVGAILSFDLGLNWDSDVAGSYRGFVLLAGNTELINIAMSNNGTIRIQGNPMFNNYGTNAMPLSFEYVADGQIRVRGTGRDGVESYNQTLTVPAGAPNKIKFYFNKTSNEPQRQMYADNFKIVSAGQGAKKQDSVTITREDDGKPRIEATGSRSISIGENGTAFALGLSLTNATAASWSASLTALNGSHVQSWSNVAGATWNWTWTAYAAGTWRLRVTAHAAGGAAITNTTLVLTATEGVSYTLGNAWHCPTNNEPFEAKYMRHPVTPGVGETIEIYVGNYHPQGDMNGGTLHYRWGTSGAWSSTPLSWTNNTNGDNNRYWVGTQVVPGDKKGSIFQYYLEVTYTDGSPANTFVAMDPDQSAMYKTFKRAAAAQATPFEVGIRDDAGQEPGYIWHGGDITVAGEDSVQIGAKIGFIKNGVKWADTAVVRYRVAEDAPGAKQARGLTRILKSARSPRSWNALTNQVSMAYEGEIPDSSPNGNAMRWVATITDSNLLNERAVLIYEVYAKGANGVWRQAEYNAGGGSSTFEYRPYSEGADDLQVRGNTRDYDSGWLAADYTTTKYFINEADAQDTVTITVRYKAPANAQKVELFTNLGRRDFADADMNNDGWPDGIIPPAGDSVTAANTYNVGAGYWQAIPMTAVGGAWQKTLTVNKCGAYRISARFLAAGAAEGDWTWYSAGPDNSLRRDHAVVISPRKALEQTMYELNVFTIKATNTAQTGRGTFEKLSEKLNAGGGAYDEFSLAYLNKLNINCLWFQPIHPSGGDRVEIDPATSNRYWPGSPYGTKNYFSVNPDMSDSATESAAVSAFTNFVRLCDRARGENMPENERTVNTVNVMLDGVMNHTSWDAIYGAGLAFATNGLGAAAIAELTNAYGNIAALTPGERIATTGKLGINWYSAKTNYAKPATYYNTAHDNDIGVAPERVDFGKWDDVAELLYGNYSTMVRWDDRVPPDYNLTEETSRMYNEDDRYYYNEMLPATKLLWKYMASYPEYWLKKTGHSGTNQPGQKDGNGVLLDDYGIDGLRCDYAQGLPSQFWEYLINRTRSKKWNFLFMAESLDGGLVGKRSNRHFDILNENMVFRFTQDKVSQPAPFQTALEERRTLYGNGIILLNLSSHDEPLPFGDPWATASRYAMVSAIDGVPMILLGQEHAISPYKGEGDTINKWKGFYFFEQNFGKWIPHFKKWNQMYVWDDPCYPSGDFRESRKMAELYGRINKARLMSPALRSKNRWFLNDNPRLMTVAKWETPGANPNVRDAVIASVLFMNEGEGGLVGNAQTYDLSPFADKLGIENRADRLYNIRNLAASDPEALIWPVAKAGSEIITNFYIGLDGGMDGTNPTPAKVWADGAVVQYLQFVDVTAYAPPVIQVGTIPTNKAVGQSVSISVTATGDGEPIVTLTNAPAGLLNSYTGSTLAFTPTNAGGHTFYFIAQNQRNDAFATTNFTVTILGGGGAVEPIEIVAINNIVSGGGQVSFTAEIADLPEGVTSLPIYAADQVVNGKWNWSFVTNVVVGSTTVNATLVLDEVPTRVITLGQPPVGMD